MGFKAPSNPGLSIISTSFTWEQNSSEGTAEVTNLLPCPVRIQDNSSFCWRIVQKWRRLSCQREISLPWISSGFWKLLFPWENEGGWVLADGRAQPGSSQASLYITRHYLICHSDIFKLLHNYFEHCTGTVWQDYENWNLLQKPVGFCSISFFFLTFSIFIFPF